MTQLRSTPNRARTARTERLGIVSYTNVAPLHYGLEPWAGAAFVRGVPTELNRRLLDGDIDLTLVSSVEFLRHRDVLRALPDFSISTLGPVYSVMLFHRVPWNELSGKRVALTTDSATSVELLKLSLREAGLEAEFVPMAPDLDAMLATCDAALLIGDVALREAVDRREANGADYSPARSPLPAEKCSRRGSPVRARLPSPASVSCSPPRESSSTP